MSFIERLPRLGSAEVIARHVQKVSDLYIQRSHDISRIWHTPDLAAAYISYFLPLNMLRLSSVLREAQEQNFFVGIEQVLDFGSGPGTFDLTATSSEIKFASLHFIEAQTEAITWHQKLLKIGLQIESKNDSYRKWVAPAQINTLNLTRAMAVFSYSLNEIIELPQWAYNAEAIMLVEPSQQKNGRDLQALRQKLIEQGFSIWAPCTHQKLCPLQEHSKTDWCHNRIHVELPTQLKDIERFLPMKNQSLTYSYLLARKTPATPTNQVRLIGDTLFERGKVKQAACRGDKREFLTWLTRHGEPAPLPRGSKITLPDSAEVRGNEIRMPSETSKD